MNCPRVNRRRRLASRPVTRVIAVMGALSAALLACSGEEPLQGTTYMPDGRLPLGVAAEAGSGEADAGDDASDGSPGQLPVDDAGALPENTCETARAVGVVSGDVGADAVTATGTCSEWVSVRVTEGDNGAFGAPMKVRLTLVPARGDFDMYAYVDPARDRLACEVPYGRSFEPGIAPEVISLSWGEGTFSNGGDDGRTVVVAILKTGSPCGTGEGWTFTAEGNR